MVIIHQVVVRYMWYNGKRYDKNMVENMNNDNLKN